MIIKRVIESQLQNTLSVIFLMLLPIEWGIAQQVTNAKSSGIDREYFSRFSVEGEIQQGIGVNGNFNLDDDDEEGTLNLEPSIELGVTYDVSKDALVYLNLQYGRELEIEEEEGERTYEPTLEIDEAYVQFSDFYEIDDVAKKTSLTLGRFSVSDKREWYFDKSLDGVLLSFELQPISTEFILSINREELIGSDLLQHNDFDPVNNFIVVAEHEPFKNVDIEFSAYAVVRDDRSTDNESPRLFGVGSSGDLADKRISYWTDFAWARGEDDDEKINGYGLDVGATMFFSTGRSPYVTMGYAFGSGDGDEDTDFRQTDLQGNSDKLGGVSSLKYYGELLDPELSNLHIFTAGIGFRYRSSASVDFVLHHYRQDVALDELRSSDIDTDPNGVSKEIGVELDIVWGLALSSSLETELVFGYFQPGSAFDDDKDDAYLIEASLSYKF